MKIAYLIVAFHQPKHFMKMIAALDSHDVHFFVHIDSKSQISKFTLPPIKGKVTFLTDRVLVTHSGWSLTLSMLKLLQKAVRNGPFDFYITLSGQCYPIKSNDFIFSFLNKNKGTNFISFYPLVGNADLIGHIKNYHFVDFIQNLPGTPHNVKRGIRGLVRLFNIALPDRPFIKGFVPFRGSAWFCLNQETAKFVCQFVDSKIGHRFIRHFRFVSASDEIFFHTIVLNSRYASQCSGYEDFIHQPGKERKNENKAYLHYVDWSPTREDPAILKEGDFDLLKKSDFLFARKFDEEISKGLIEYINDCLLGLH